MNESAITLEALKSELDRQIEGPPFHHWLKPVARGVDAAEKSVYVAIDFRPELGHMKGSDAFHGGVIAALADITGHATVAVWQGSATPTISLQVEYLSLARGQTLLACGRLRKLGRSIGRADVELSVDGRLVALARGTFSTGRK